MRGARIGVPRNLIELDDPAFNPYVPVLPVFEAALSVFRSAGAIIINDLFLPGYETTKKEQLVFENLVLNTDFPRMGELHLHTVLRRRAGALGKYKLGIDGTTVRI